MKFTTWQDVMIYLAGGNEPVCGDTQKEALEFIAKKLGKAMSTTYGYFEGRGEPGISEARNLHENLVKDYGCSVVERYMNDEFYGQGGNADGKIQDDMWNIHEQSTDAARYYKKAKNGDLDALQKYFDEVNKISVEVEDLLAEGQRIRKKYNQ